MVNGDAMIAYRPMSEAVFDNTITYSSSSLLNLFFPNWQRFDQCSERLLVATDERPTECVIGFAEN